MGTKGPSFSLVVSRNLFVAKPTLSINLPSLTTYHLGHVARLTLFVPISIPSPLLILSCWRNYKQNAYKADFKKGGRPKGQGVPAYGDPPTTFTSQHRLDEVEGIVHEVWGLQEKQPWLLSCQLPGFLITFNFFISIPFRAERHPYGERFARQQLITDH